MYTLRAIAATLSILAISYVVFSALVAASWRALAERFSRRSSVSFAQFLYGLRTAPLAAAIVVALCFELPSFLFFEPKVVDEPLAPVPVILSILCIAFAVVVLWRTAAACRHTSDLCRSWTTGCYSVHGDEQLPVYETNASGPAVAVVGVRTPRLLLSPGLKTILERGELERALAHETAHVRHRDNLRKLMLLLCRFPGMKKLDAAWAEAVEFAADERAVHSKREALDLASALVKISALSTPAGKPEALVTNFVGGSTSMARRVERLASWEQERGESRLLIYPVLGIAATGTVLMLSYGAILTRLHSFTEILFR